MAEEQEDAPPPSPPAKGGPGRYLILIIIVMLVETAGAYLLLDWAIPAPEVVEQEEPEEILVEETFVPPIFYPDLAQLVFSPLESNGRNLVRTTMVLEVNRMEVLDELSIKHTQIWDLILRLMEGMPIEVLREPSRERVKNVLKASINEELRNGEVLGIYFTEFIMQ